MTWYSIIHGPEAWLAMALVSAGPIVGVVLGMWMAALLAANREDDDDEQ